MNPARIVIATHRRLPLALLVCASLVLSAACVYRPTIQQGNLLRLEDVDQVTVGMTRSQVRYLLGTPMVADPFQPDRWDYIYTLHRGHERRADRSYFVVHFENDRVSKVDKVDAPDLSDIEKMRERQGARKGTQGSPPTPSPRTDATNPGN